MVALCFVISNLMTLTFQTSLFWKWEVNWIWSLCISITCLSSSTSSSVASPRISQPYTSWHVGVVLSSFPGMLSCYPSPGEHEWWHIHFCKIFVGPTPHSLTFVASSLTYLSSFVSAVFAVCRWWWARSWWAWFYVAEFEPASNGEGPESGVTCWAGPAALGTRVTCWARPAAWGTRVTCWARPAA